MSSARQTILDRVRAATRSLPEPTARPSYPESLPASNRAPTATDPASLRAHFGTQLRSTGAHWAEDWAALAALLQQDAPALGYCAPAFLDALRAVWPDAPLESTFDRTRVDDYVFGVTPAWGAIAETGTLILTDADTPSRLAALAPWVHAAVVPAARIFPTVADAIRALPRDPSIIFITGPSKTADIEGILIEGVHGPGRQYALVV